MTKIDYPHIVVIDPAVKKPELEAFNWLVRRAPLPLTYHLPALFGFNSLEREHVGIRGVVILGSLSSVNERLDWQISLEKWLMPHLQNKAPTFGICYGHQMLAHMFGGTVQYLSPDRKKYVGAREIHFEADALWGKAMRGKICVSHNEVVTRAPDDMHVIGKSDDVAIDALRHKTLPIWSFQSHPEAGGNFLSNRGLKVDMTENELKFGYDLLGYFFDWVKKGSG